MSGAHQGSATAMAGASAKSILIEGWRASNHSLALVNQHQILELNRRPGLHLFHHDAPLHMEGWAKNTSNSGFSAADRLIIDSLSEPAAETVDCVYRIYSPFQASAGTDRRKTVTFIVSELGPFNRYFQPGSARPELFTRDDNNVVTPTCWSRDRLVEWGLPADKVSIVPHGVDVTHFYPLEGPQRRAARRVLGIAEDETVFLNVGAALWNKGVDLLLIAFAYLRVAGRRVRLILRNRIDIYGLSIGNEMKTLVAKAPELFTADTLAAISVISHDMTRDQLRHLYSAADCYVSPYRAEGFNLPVLEAIACGTPVIVTRGGATDDFCNDQVAVRIRSEPGQSEDLAQGHRGQFLTPHLGDLAEAMDSFVNGQPIAPDPFDAARQSLITKFSWRNAAVQLAQIMVGNEGDAPA